MQLFVGHQHVHVCFLQKVKLSYVIQQLHMHIPCHLRPAANRWLCFACSPPPCFSPSCANTTQFRGASTYQKAIQACVLWTSRRFTCVSRPRRIRVLALTDHMMECMNDLYWVPISLLFGVQLNACTNGFPRELLFFALVLLSP